MATSAYASTSDTTNAIRASRVLLGPCSDQLRDVLRRRVDPANFPHVIRHNRRNLPRLTLPQRDLILPRTGHYSGDYSDMDASLMYLLLRNICNIKPHKNGWGNSPDVTDLSLAASIERIHEARNKMVHSSIASLSDNDFTDIWSYIKDAVKSMDAFLNNGKKYEKEMDFLFTETMDPELLRKQGEEDTRTREYVRQLQESVNDQQRNVQDLRSHQQELQRQQTDQQVCIQDLRSQQQELQRQQTHQYTTLTDRLEVHSTQIADLSHRIPMIHVMPGFQDKKHIRNMVGKVTVDLIRGSLVDRKVDVLVNVTNASLTLDRGALSKAISEAAGANLQLECKNIYPEGLELGEVGSTRAFEIEDVKTIYHTTLPPYSNGQGCPEEVLLFLVQRCLGKASEENYCSIGFPAVGTGCQGYPSKTAAKTMMSAIKEFFNASPSSTLVKVEILVYEGGKDWREVWMSFQQELEKIAPIAEDVKKGHQGYVLTPNQAVATRLPSPPERGTNEWFKMKYEQDVFIPVYWTSVKGGENVRKCQRSSSKDYELVDVDSVTEQIIKDLVMKTWVRYKVGDGRDAKNLRYLGFSSINVTRIQRVENVHLYKGYAEERQRLFDKASKKGRPFVSVGQTKNSSKEVETYSVLKSQGNATKFLSDTFSEINEHFLFHGTAGDNIEKVLSQGIDNRLVGDRAMFGAGIYAAESSTKADQYSDHRDSRTVTGLKMLLVRMSLGDVCLCNQGQPFRRAPCKICQKDKCTCKGAQLWDFYDSVVGDGQWIFREFVVYDKRQVYPEYLISYDRV